MASEVFAGATRKMMGGWHFRETGSAGAGAEEGANAVF